MHAELSLGPGDAVTCPSVLPLDGQVRSRNPYTAMSFEMSSRGWENLEGQKHSYFWTLIWSTGPQYCIRPFVSFKLGYHEEPRRQPFWLDRHTLRPGMFKFFLQILRMTRHIFTGQTAHITSFSSQLTSLPPRRTGASYRQSFRKSPGLHTILL